MSTSASTKRLVSMAETGGYQLGKVQGFPSDFRRRHGGRGPKAQERLKVELLSVQSRLERDFVSRPTRMSFPI